MKKIYVVFLFFSTVITFSQNRENIEIQGILKQISDSKTDTTTINLCNKIANIYAKSNPNQGIVYAKKALLLSEKTNWQTGIANSSMTLGTNYFAKSDFFNALIYFEKTLQNNPKKPLKAATLKNIGLCYSYQNDYPKALDFGTQALNIYEELSDKAGIAVALSNIGIVYCDWQNYPKAIAFYKKAQKINTEINNQSGLSQNFGNLGNVYSLMKNDQKAIEYYEKSLEISEKIGDLIGKSISLGSVSSSYLNLKQFDKSLENVESALAIAQKMGVDGIVGFLMSIKADIYFQKGSSENNTVLIDKSVETFKKALEIHRKINSQKEISSDLDYLSKVYDYKKDYKNALETYRTSIVYKDSIFNTENKETIKNIEDKRTIALREKEIKINALRKEKQQLYFVSGIVLLIFVGLFLMYQSQNRKKNNLKLQKLVVNLDRANKTKAQFFGILNHDLRSPVSNLIHFLHLQKERPDLLAANMKAEIENETISAAENLLTSMEDILQWSKSQLQNFEPSFEKIAIKNVFTDIEKHFEYEKSIAFQFINPEKIAIFTDENYLKTIVRNLTGNAIKSMGNIENGKIIWKAFTENNRVLLSISDNGKGATQDQFRALYDETEVVGIQSGLGLHLIRDLAKAIDCEITVDSKIGVGTTFTLKL